jgi:formylglycine-generating enzyme required for sulfatase activity
MHKKGGNMKANLFRVLILMLFLIVGTIFSAEETPRDQTPQGMVFVKGGKFQMGTNELATEEEPVHSVTLDSFYMGKFEVTQEEWEAVMDNNPSIYKGDNLPVDNVDWYNAVEYCNKRSEKEGLTPCYKGSGDDITCDFNANGYRLPTEAEWEYACRGGLESHNYMYSGSNNPDEVAWHEMNSEDKTQPVGKKKPNEIGIYDMSGNIWEWCWDWYDKEYYKNSPANNPKGAASGKQRSYRGGGGPGGRIMWLRSTERYSLEPTYKSFDMGLRIVKNTTGEKPGNMVLVKGGTFMMGSNDGKNGEKAVHTVTLNSFYIGKFEVTQAEWCAVMGKNPAAWPGTKSPVESINWYDAVEYCNQRSRKEGLTPCYTGSGDQISCNFEVDGYRLPTEAEWEYACRGGAASGNYKYSGSNNLDEVGWYKENATFKTEPVGQKKPNELGIYDMNGNVWEWCWDWFDREYYKNSAPNNPKGPLSGIRRVIRGCSIDGVKHMMEHTYRGSIKPNYVARSLGFRVVRTAK